MKRFGIAFLFVLGLSTAWAQTTIPGTFNVPAGQPTVVVGGPILTPPLVSFGSGLTPPAVINGQVAIATTPQSTVALPSLVTNNSEPPLPGYISTGRSQGVATAGNQAGGNLAADSSRQAYFDYVVAQRNRDTESAAACGVGDPNLGQIAAGMRKGPPPTQRTFTNADIARINGMNNSSYPMPAGSQPNPQQQQPQQTQPHSKGNGSQAKPSPFSPRPVAEQ